MGAKPMGKYKSKREWIAAQPLNLTVQQVIAKGEKLGVKIYDSEVYQTRVRMNGRAASAANGHGSNGHAIVLASQAEAGEPAAPSEPPEVAFRRLLVEIGLTRAERIIAEVRAQSGGIPLP